ncbi:hypothetical protein PRELSG_0012050 [Plasmodium relictum]|uniref:Uncharacterized protein n=1 Tax=Plasmodium relictum TaxID=85471 RepID=A0A1J1GK17_PLARL|nr:hypothetical protein PRELSG_0012050 [Plasmodium relictum]CRG84359.1 hypothetical protein PRELSG_0012050 [Plasmodium relictum]
MSMHKKTIEIIQKENFNQWNEEELERNLCISHIYTKSKEFSIDIYEQENSDKSNKDINNISSITLSNDQILRSLSTMKKEINNKDNKITRNFLTSNFISSDILDSDDIFFNNEIIETMKALYYFNLSKIVMFLHKIHLRKRLNKKSYMSCIVSIIILFLQPVNTTQRICSSRLSFLCNSLSTMCDTNANAEGRSTFCTIIKDQCKGIPRRHVVDLGLHDVLDELIEGPTITAIIAFIFFLFLIYIVMNNIINICILLF